MSSMILSRRDLEFLLYEWLDVAKLTQRARFADHSRETFDAAMDTCEQIATDLFAPHNKKNDQQEPHFDGESVQMIPEVGVALKAFREAGLMAAGQDFELGGMQLPCVVEKAGFAYFKGANVGTASYPRNGTLCGLPVAFVKGQSEAGAQSVRQQLGTQGLIPARRPQPWSSTCEDLSGHFARGRADGQCIRLHHLRGVGRE